MFEFFETIGQYILDGLAYFFGVLGNFISGAFNTLLNFLGIIFKPILWLINGFLYLLEKIFQIVVLIIQIIYHLFLVLWSIAEGLFRTLFSFNYTGTSQYYRLPSQYSEGFTAVSGFLSNTGFNTIALILAVFVWILGAIIIIRMIGERT